MAQGDYERLIDRSDDEKANASSFGIGGRVVAGLTCGLLLVAGIGGWAAMAELEGAVIASGVVKVDRDIKSIQHRDGGIISEIAVREGDVVTAGQVLLRVDDAETRAELSIARAQLLELSVKKARLIAERDGSDRIVVPKLPASNQQLGEFFGKARLITVAADQRAAPDDEAADHINQVLRGEMRLLEGNLRNRKSQIDQLSLSIEQLGEEIRGLKAQHAAKLNELTLVEAEHGKIQGLADRKLIEGSRAFTTSRELSRLQGEVAEIEASIARAKVRISEVKLQIISVEETARTEAQRELSVVDPKLNELKERSVAIQDRLLRTDIRAPIAGTINEVAVSTVGGVITSAEKLITIVPRNAKLTIEAKLFPTDIDQVVVGQPAKLRFSAFNQRTTPELFGEVAYVSAATSVDPESGHSYYLAKIAVPETELAKLGNELRPGMPLDVFITTENRTAMSYLAKPVLDQFQRALREQ